MGNPRAKQHHPWPADGKAQTSISAPHGSACDRAMSTQGTRADSSDGGLFTSMGTSSCVFPARSVVWMPPACRQRDRHPSRARHRRDSASARPFVLLRPTRVFAPQVPYSGETHEANRTRAATVPCRGRIQQCAVFCIAGEDGSPGHTSRSGCARHGWARRRAPVFAGTRDRGARRQQTGPPKGASRAAASAALTAALTAAARAAPRPATYRALFRHCVLAADSPHPADTYLAGTQRRTHQRRPPTSPPPDHSSPDPALKPGSRSRSAGLRAPLHPSYHHARAHSEDCTYTAARRHARPPRRPPPWTKHSLEPVQTCISTSSPPPLTSTSRQCHGSRRHRRRCDCRRLRLMRSRQRQTPAQRTRRIRTGSQTRPPAPQNST